MSDITIIDKNSHAPIWKYKPPPNLNTKLEWDRYYDAQRKLWIEGYADIPPTLIFKAQECLIKDRVVTIGKSPIIRPMTRYVDLMVHQFLWQQMKDKREIALIIKPRGVGLSTDFGVLANYSLVAMPGSTVLMTSKNQTAIVPLFKDKVLIAYDNLNTHIKPTKIGGNVTKDACLITVADLMRIDNQEIYIESNIVCKESSEKPSSPNNFSGYGANMILVDELGLHRRRKELLKSTVECLRDPMTKESKGILIGGGTLESTITGDDLTEYVSLIKDTDPRDILFIPFFLQMFLDENGYPNEIKAYEWWNQEHDRLLKMDDQSFLLAFIKNNPRTLDDVLNLASSSFFESDINDKLIEQRKQTILNPVLHRQGKIIELGEQVNFTVTNSQPSYIELKENNPPFTLIEEPKQGVEYYIVIDGVATGTQSGSKDGSNVAALVLKMFDTEGDSFSFPCCYYERPRTVESSYFNILAMAKYYNRFGGFKGFMAEANAATADHFATFLRNQGFIKWAIKRKDLSGKGFSDTNKYFQPVNDITRNYQIRSANAYLRKYVQNIKLIPLLNDLIRPAAENTDLRDAFLMTFIIVKDFDTTTFKEKKKRFYQRPEYYRENGMTLVRWIDIEY